MITIEIGRSWHDFFLVKEDLSDFLIIGHNKLEGNPYQVYSDSDLLQLTLAPKVLAWWSE